jgi:hypothetical protein
MTMLTILGLDRWTGHWIDSRYPNLRGVGKENREGGCRVIAKVECLVAARV